MCVCVCVCVCECVCLSCRLFVCQLVGLYVNVCIYVPTLFLNWGSFHARLNSYYKAWSYKKKKHKKIKVKRFQLILDLKPFRAKVKGKHSISREFQSLAVRGKNIDIEHRTVDIDIIVASRNGDRKIMPSIRIMNRPPSRIRKWNQLSEFRRTSTKLIPIETPKLAAFRRWAKG